MNANITPLLLLLCVFTYSLSIPLDKSEESNSSSSSSEESKEDLEKPLDTSETLTSTTQSVYSNENIPDIKKRDSVVTNAHQGSPIDPIVILPSYDPLNSNNRHDRTGSENQELPDSQNTNTDVKEKVRDSADKKHTPSRILSPDQTSTTSTKINVDKSSKEATKDDESIVVSSTEQPGDIYGENLKKISELTRVTRDTNNQLSTPLSSNLNDSDPIQSGDSYPIQSGNSEIQKNNHDVPIRLVAGSEVSTITRPDHRNLREAISERSSTTEEPDEVKIVKLNSNPPYPSSQQ